MCRLVALAAIMVASGLVAAMQQSGDTGGLELGTSSYIKEAPLTAESMCSLADEGVSLLQSGLSFSSLRSSEGSKHYAWSGVNTVWYSTFHKALKEGFGFGVDMTTASICEPLWGRRCAQLFGWDMYGIFGMVLATITAVICKYFSGAAEAEGAKPPAETIGQLDACNQAPQPTGVGGDKSVGPPKFFAIDSARLLGAIHIIYLHYDENPTTTARGKFKGFADCGGIWLIFFFIVSGLGSATSRVYKENGCSSPMRATDLLPSPSTLFRRVASVYPMFAFALLLSLFLEWIPLEGTFRLDRSVPWSRIEPDCAALDFLMLSVFRLRECGQSYNSHDWFLGALLCCWLAENLVFSLMARLYRTGSLADRLCGKMTFLLVSVMAHVVICVAAQKGYHNYVNWWQGIPYYIVGVALAFSIKAKHIPGQLTDVAGTIALSMMFFVFLLGPIDTGTMKYSAIVWPLQLLLVVGLCGHSDAISKLFASHRLPELGSHLAMGMYLLQSPCHELWLAGPVKYFPLSKEYGMLLFLLFIAGLASVAQTFVQTPLQRVMLKFGSG